MFEAYPINNSLLNNNCSPQKAVSILEYYAGYFKYVASAHSAKYAKSVTTSFNNLFRYFERNKILSEISVMDWELFFLHQKRRSPKGVEVYFRTLKAAFSKAVEWKILSENPLGKIKLQKRQKEEQKVITLDELNKIVSAIENTQIRDLTKTAYNTGLRLSELINLKVKNIDLEERFLTVGDESFNTKSKKVRLVAICDEALKVLKLKCERKKPEDLLFGKTKKIPYSPDYVSRTFKRAVRNTKLKDQIHFHSCRHTYATRLANSELPLSITQKLLGHSDISTTMLYVHVNKDDLKRSINVLNNI
jgi:integrase/recombinase XerD